jgi:hypothetical protein
MGALILWVSRGGGDKEPSLKASSPDTMTVAAIPKTSKKSASISPIPEGNFEKASQASQTNVDVASPKPDPPALAKSQTSIKSTSFSLPNSERSESTRIPPKSFPDRPSAETMQPGPIRSVDPSAAPRLPEPDTQPHRPKSAAMIPQAASLPANIKKSPSSKVIPISSQPKLRNPLPKSSASQPSSAQDHYAHAESFASDTLQVQAISWSDLPNKRIAVIDGRILRESQVVNGYNVIQIRPEDVIVEKAGKYFKLAFGSR